MSLLFRPGKDSIIQMVIFCIVYYAESIINSHNIILYDKMCLTGFPSCLNCPESWIFVIVSIPEIAFHIKIPLLTSTG